MSRPNHFEDEPFADQNSDDYVPDNRPVNSKTQ